MAGTFISGIPFPNKIRLSQQIDSIVSNGSSKQTNYNDVRAQTVNTFDRQGKLWHHQRYTTSSNSRSAAMDRINRRKTIQVNVDFSLAHTINMNTK